jgi:hypothetical protein
MVRRTFVVCGLLLTLSLAGFGADKPEAKLPAPRTNAGLEKMKKLVGTWLTTDKDGKVTDQVASIIKVTPGGRLPGRCPGLCCCARSGRGVSDSTTAS